MAGPVVTAASLHCDLEVTDDFRLPLYCEVICFGSLSFFLFFLLLFLSLSVEREDREFEILAPSWTLVL
uniref:Uncharacterized protein n=1 Tax=Rhizophora mucronata TaxID=61149 RepID=A0A2P2NT33_RHIMU